MNKQRAVIQNHSDTPHRISNVSLLTNPRTYQVYLRSLGADRYDLLLPETYCLPRLLRVGEQPLGILYGRYHRALANLVGRGMLVATDQRLLLVDRKLFYSHLDEIPYSGIRGMTIGRVGPISTITINTRLDNFSIRTFNKRAAAQFAHAVEEILYKLNGGSYDTNSTERYLYSVRE